MTEQIFTIGHSSRTLTELLTLLAGSRIELVIDVRKLPGSTRYPQFDEDALSASLGETGIELRRFEGLTGRRPVNRDVPFEVNAWWDNRSFHNYADHALGNDFRNSLVELRACAQVSRTAIMCSEAVWWRCHRRIIADHLLAWQDDVRHILSETRIEPAQLSSGAVIGAHRRVTYPG
ncbi:hypothetical protein Mlaev_02233 [Microbacterium laevaniformans]|uniref:DUF488 domain-containing protein n=1 Tax=Microbacterium laevaniformans TaxID=36807 RepID=A0A150HBK6_9MICO|nr:DUF488 domain-containing protein [Microbacterium laevaniformans]KXZ59502.1 hypothetical protein Mlaev_02233 [Microbacterium laevaniformans]